MRSCMSAICGALYSGLDSPIANVRPKNTTRAEGGTRPLASVAAPKSAIASAHESAWFLRPPVTPIQPLAAIIPTENAISAIADCVVVPPKWSNTMSGNSAEIGENSTENANPIQSMANSPRWRLSSRKPSAVSERNARTARRDASAFSSSAWRSGTGVLIPETATAMLASTAPATSSAIMKVRPNAG